MLEEIFEYFGGKSATARILGVAPPAVSQWVIDGLPAGRAIDIERISGGHFKAVDIAGAKGDDK